MTAPTLTVRACRWGARPGAPAVASSRELRGCDRLATRSPDRVLLGERCAGSSAGAAQGEEALDASPCPAPKASVNPSRSATVTVSAEWPLRRSGDGTFSAKWMHTPASWFVPKLKPSSTPEGHQQRQIPPVNSVGKTFGHDGSHPLTCTSATEPRYCPISTLHRKLRQELGAKGGPARPSPADFAPSQGSISTRSKRNSSSTHPFPILARSWLSAEVLPGCGLMSDGLRRRASTSRASARTDLARLPRATDGEPSIVPGASSEPGQWRVIEDDYLGAFVGSGSWCAACVHGGTVHGPGGSSGGGPARRARMPARAVPRRGPSGRSCAGRGWAAILRRSSGL